MNNIQQTRIQLEKTYQSMGGQELEEDAASILNQMQSKLNGVLDHLAHVFAIRFVIPSVVKGPAKLFFSLSFNRRVDVSVVAMGKLLWEVKGGGQGQAISKSEVQVAADAILQPLMDLLDGNFFLRKFKCFCGFFSPALVFFRFIEHVCPDLW